jgi:hypothetical protein
MVRTLSLSTEWRVVVTVFRSTGSSVLQTVYNLGALDAFDYAIQAQGYFRFAVQQMDVRELTIDVINPQGAAIETIEVTKD